jgi:hypothetical protein
MSVSFILCLTHKLSIGIHFHSYLFTKGGESNASQVSLFLAINAKGVEINRPKAKGLHNRTTTHFSNF